MWVWCGVQPQRSSALVQGAGTTPVDIIHTNIRVCNNRSKPETHTHEKRHVTSERVKE